MPTPTTAARPSLPRRLAALSYDLLLVIALIAVVNALALGLQVALAGRDHALLSPWLVQLLTLMSIAGFFCLFWLHHGQTLGMQAWRVQLVSIDGRPLTFGRALRRCLGAALSLACLGLGYLWCLVDRHQRYWHDYLSGTELILLPRRESRRDQPQH